MIRKGLLSNLFVGVVAKRLTLVETVSDSSNQHEFQGTKPLRNLLGTEDRRRIPARFVWLAEEQSAISEDGFLSWSNVRKGKPRAPEFHLYYSGNAVTEAMKPDDTMFLALRPEGAALVIIAPAASTMHSQLLWLFDLPRQQSFGFVYRDIAHGRESELDFAARYILDELGVEFEEPDTDQIDSLLEPFGAAFPATRIFSDLARRSLPDIDPRDEPDRVLMAWIEREEAMFRRLERKVVSDRLRAGFVAMDEADIDGFLAFSLSVQNRRKARAGQSLENHLEALFRARNVRFARGAETENRNRPDFLFPGHQEYANAEFPTDRLTMLGAKSTLKDRWRQVLAEARRIERKHLMTLEPGVSEAQTGQMHAAGLQLVVPASLHRTFRPTQRTRLMDLQQFIDLVLSRQV